jgi:hypothetical protein
MRMRKTGFLQAELLVMPGAGNQGNKGGFGLLFCAKRRGDGLT